MKTWTTWIFFEDGKQNTPEFEIEAANPSHAYDKAVKQYGPQVEDLMYAVKPKVKENMTRAEKYIGDRGFKVKGIGTDKFIIHESTAKTACEIAVLEYRLLQMQEYRLNALNYTNPQVERQINELESKIKAKEEQ